MRKFYLLACTAVAVCFAGESASAHGFAGARFFPATLITDDPFVADEWSFPTVNWARDADRVATTTASLDFAKRITSDFAVGMTVNYVDLHPSEGRDITGFDNVSVGAKYQVMVDAAHETIFAVGVDAGLGGTGAKRIGADSFSTITPAVFFGRGLGDIGELDNPIRALAVTGSVGISVPTAARVPGGPADTLQMGLALEYSLIYLQTQVRDVGLRPPFDRMIPVVEVALSEPLDSVSGRITGTVAPGVLWSGQYMQLGAEALFPVNRASGRGVGFIAQLHLYIDDIFPQTIGRPLLGA